MNGVSRRELFVIANSDDLDGTNAGQGRFKVCRSSREETSGLPFSGNDGGGLESPRAAGTGSHNSVKAQIAEGCTVAPFAILELRFLGEWVGVLIAVVSS
jgi:hypothetical protein